VNFGAGQSGLQNEHNYSAFGSVSWKATDLLKLSAGLRGSWVKKDYVHNTYSGVATTDFGNIVPFAGMPIAATGGDRSDQGWMPSAGIQYKVSPHAMAYFSYARGFKAGGFNLTDSTGDLTNVPFGPEHVNAYEIGLKSEWFDDRVRLNFDVFRSDYRDLQVGYFKSRSDAVTKQLDAVTGNAAASRSQGVELEGRWAVGRTFRLSSNLTYLDSYYISYANAGASLLQVYCATLDAATFAAIPQCRAFPFPVPPTQDLAGKPTDFAPKWSGSITATYTVVFPRDYKIVAELSPFFSSSYNPDVVLPGPPSYVRLDGRLGLEGAEGNWAVDVIGKNMTDHVIRNFGYSSPFTNSKQRPRNFALQFSYRW
jgi:outer membrane receptor protein involved in Fe transport